MKRIALAVILTAFLTGPALAMHEFPKCSWVAHSKLYTAFSPLYVGPSNEHGALPADEHAFVEGLLLKAGNQREAHQYDQCQNTLVTAASILCAAWIRWNDQSRFWPICY